MIKLAKDKNNKQLVDMLCVAYAKELKAYHGYLHAYVSVTGPLQEVYGETYKKFMERELHHLEELGKKITAMGGMPPTEYPPITAVAEAIYKGYDATLEALQNAEVETLDMYKSIHQAADKDGDLPLVLLIEEIMLEEEEHHDELERILLDVPKKNNVEKHDQLVVDACAERIKKLAGILGGT
jgi:bacterioferritin (cytochrome b1)